MTLHRMLSQQILACLLCITMLGLPLVADAARVSGLYSVEVVVADKTAQERKRAEQQGLETVLVKVSGSSKTIARTQAARNKIDASRYVSEFSYRSDKIADTGEKQTLAVINYSSSMIDSLLANTGCPIWPADRPELLVWMVADQAGEGRSHVTKESMPEAKRLLKQQMAARGEHLLEPLLDLEDHLTLSAQDAWAFKHNSLVAAARRYKVPNWCVLRFYQTSSGRFRGTVQVEAGVHSGLVNLNAATLESLIQQGVNEAVDRVAAGSTFIRQQNVEEFALLLENINNYKDYSAAIELLNKLEMVRAVRVASAVGDHLDLRLDINGGPAGLLKLLNRNKHLKPIADVNHSQTSSRFSWQ